METHRLHFIITIFIVASFCISRAITVFAMEAAAAATKTPSVVNSDDSPLPLPYSDDFQDSAAGVAVNPSLSSEDPASFTTLKKNNNRRLKSILVGVVFGGLGFVLLLVLLCLCIRKGNQRERVVGSPPPVGGSPLLLPPPAAGGGGESISSSIGDEFSNLGVVITMEQILNATGGFSSSNLIKPALSWDVFQGVLENGIPVAIKRIDVGSPQKKESYMAELDFYRSSASSHTRLVPLLGHCSDQEKEKFLVYKYMPKEDLFNCFHYWEKNKGEGGRLQSLDWITRMKIVVGVAEGLCYLHHECNPPLVHRNVQERSILVDDNFEVCLGSLSKICTQEVDTVITRLLRLWRRLTSSEEDGSPSATCAYDVYCFGKVLLGLVTGKLGITGVSNSTFTNAWLEQTLPLISTSEYELVKNIMDRFLSIKAYQVEEVWAMAVVAKLCLHRIPSKRPPMTDILKAVKNPLQVVRELREYNNSFTSAHASWLMV